MVRGLIRAQHDRVLLERIKVLLADCLVEGRRLEDDRRQKELVRQLLAPLLPQVGRHDHEEAALALGPLLGKEQPRFDGLPEPHLIGEDRPLRERALEGEEGGFDLMRVEIHLRVGEHRGQFLDAIRGAAPSQLVGEVLRVVVGQLHRA